VSTYYGGGGTTIPPTTPPMTPPTTTTPTDGGVNLPGGSTVTTPEDQPHVTNPDGSTTLPGGGTVKTGDGGSTITLPGGSVIDGDGKITVGSGGGSITHDNGHSFDIQEDTVIILDEDTPLGYYALADNPFADVKESDWFFDNMMFAYTHGLFAGTSDTTFSPNTSMTRGMIVTVLYRLAGEPAVSGTNPFSDVKDGTLYTDAVAWAAANGIVSGIGGGKYAPDAPITRQDLAVILMRYANFAGVKLPVTREYVSFLDDADIANYAKEAIEAFFKAGIINGKPGNEVDPTGTATRAEVAAMLHRFLEAMEK
jgi:hypothetical protein